MSLAAKLKELRGKNRQSLQDVADAIGASKTHIYDLETGRSTNPSIELLTKLATHFRVAIADLLGENPEGKDEEPGLVAMYRDLKSLAPQDRETIQMLMDRLKPKGK
jgi:transcriptional regulator with XRE-family HTH domain